MFREDRSGQTTMHAMSLNVVRLKNRYQMPFLDNLAELITEKAEKQQKKTLLQR